MQLQINHFITCTLHGHTCTFQYKTNTIQPSHGLWCSASWRWPTW